MQTARPAAVAGTFYPGEPSALATQVASHISSASADRGLPAPKAIIAPHAGYIYSGPIAGTAYARLAERAGRIARVVLVGPAHRAWIAGMAVPSVARFDSPLGGVALDAPCVARLARVAGVEVSDPAHALEHSLEVHLPFLQAALGTFLLVPIVVGGAGAQDVERVLDMLWGGEETLIVVSSDLSHYLAYDAACRRDHATADAIVALDARLDHEQACGATAINGLLRVAHRRGLVARALDLRNSGDTAGARDRVVGYGAFTFHEREQGRSEALDARGPTLLAIARGSIAAALGAGAMPAVDDEWLRERAATFVTLRLAGALRGCIGSIDPRRALREDVAANAQGAAFRDPRFPPVTAESLAALEIEVSLLSPRTALAVASESEALAALRPGIDGVYLEYAQASATYLPQVWDSIPDPLVFLSELRRKAGLEPRFWHRDLRLSRYRVVKFSESDG